MKDDNYLKNVKFGYGVLYKLEGRHAIIFSTSVSMAVIQVSADDI
jgi:hypothetical protein